MHMAVDETRRNQRAAVVGDARLRVGAPQVVGFAQGGDPAVVDQNGPTRRMARRIRPFDQRIAGKAQGLANQKVCHEFAPVILA